MTSAKFSDFWTPSPLVCIFTQPPLLSLLTASAFGVPPPPSLCRHHIYMPPQASLSAARADCDLARFGDADDDTDDPAHSVCWNVGTVPKAYCCTMLSLFMPSPTLLSLSFFSFSPLLSLLLIMPSSQCIAAV